MLQKRNNPVRIQGKFGAEITIREKAGIDLDNRCKCVLDWAVKMNLVEDDSLLRELRMVYGNEEDTPSGACLRLYSV